MSKIAERISKLIAKAEATTHEEEADAFMSKAQQLMEEHGLNLLQLGKLDEDPIGLQEDAIRTAASYPWARKIANALSHYYGCRFVYYQRGNQILYDVAGRESARVTFTLMLPFVLKQVHKLSGIAFNKGVYPARMTAKTRIGNATAERIWSMCPKTEKNEGTGVNALVPVDLLEQLIDEANPNLKIGRATVTKFDHYAHEASKSVSVNRQTTSEGLKRLT